MAGVFQKAVFAVSQVATDLFHLRGIRARCDTSDVYAACLQMHDCEHIESDQYVPCPDFNGRKIRGKDGIPVCFQELEPRWCSLPVGCWLNAVCIEHIGDRRVDDVVTNVLQCSLNSIVSPRRILPREANNRIHEDLSNSWPAGLLYLRWNQASFQRVHGASEGSCPA